MLFGKLKKQAEKIKDAVKETAKEASNKASEYIPDEVADRAQELKDNAKKITETAKNKAGEYIPDEVEQYTNTVKNNLKDAAETASSKIGEYLDSHLEEIESYCSWCFEKHDCTPVEKNYLKRNIYTCNGCGKEVVKCRACNDKAKSGEGWNWESQFCAVHEGTIAKFPTLNLKLATIGEYRDIFEREDINYKKIGTTAAYTIGGAAVIAPLAFAAAPAIGGAVGSILGLSGAAATNAGLATLGGGALAAGGAGMAGGVAVLTAVGSALGGKLGAVISNSYFGDIKGFEIKKIKHGIEPSIICIDGFLTEKGEKADSWLEPITKIYPENTIYVVRWESKRLLDIGKLCDFEIKKGVGFRAVKTLALRASKKAATKLSPLSAAFTAVNIATNPWSVARIKALQTGALLADIIARTEKKHILVGHSLGARVIYSCLAALKTKEQQYIQDVHLLGGAVNNSISENDEIPTNWFNIHKAVSGNIFNYFSQNDDVLKYMYPVGEFFQGEAIGRNKIDSSFIKNIDVSNRISGHSKYKECLAKVIQTE